MATERVTLTLEHGGVEAAGMLLATEEGAAKAVLARRAEAKIYASNFSMASAVFHGNGA